MSIITERATSVGQSGNDEIYVIYGDEGTGKTVLASTFPKTKEKPLLYLDVLEGGTGSISAAERDNIVVVPVEKFEEIDSILSDVMAGKTKDATGKDVSIAYSTIVIDSGTQLEYLIKQHLMNQAGKSKMDLNLWGNASSMHDTIWNMCKALYKKTKSKVVVIFHQKEEKDENNPTFAKLIPSIMSKAAHAICAKASYVWYTRITDEQVVDQSTNEVKTITKFNVIIDTDSYLLTKCRKPPETKIPHDVNNLTYPMFKKNIIDKLQKA